MRFRGWNLWSHSRVAVFPRSGANTRHASWSPSGAGATVWEEQGAFHADTLVPNYLEILSKEFIFLTLTIPTLKWRLFTRITDFQVWVPIRIIEAWPHPAGSDSVGLWSDRGASIFRKTQGDLPGSSRFPSAVLVLALKALPAPPFPLEGARVCPCPVLSLIRPSRSL